MQAALPGLGELDLPTVALQQLACSAVSRPWICLLSAGWERWRRRAALGEVELLGDSDEVAQVPQMDVHSQSRSEHVLDAACDTLDPRTDGPATRRAPGGGHRLQQRPRRSDRPSPQRRGARCRSRATRRSGARVVESIRAEGGEAMAALANLADATECTAFVCAAQEAGPVDILINNAGALPTAVGRTPAPRTGWSCTPSTSPPSFAACRGSCR